MTCSGKQTAADQLLVGQTERRSGAKETPEVDEDVVVDLANRTLSEDFARF